MIEHPKTRASELAILGGEPAFHDQLHVGRPNLPPLEAFLARAKDIFERRWLSNNGYYVQELERRLCDYLGVKHCIPMCNGTVALEIAIRAAGLRGEVIVPSFTFVATAHALTWQEIEPVFCEVDPRLHLLDLEDLEAAITPRTSGIIGVHTWGQPCYPEELARIADRHGLKLMFDAAHAFGCSHRGVMLGNFGLAEVLSFHATKFFNTFEGGAVATNDDELAASIRLIKNFGFSGYDNAVLVGTNGKMSEVCAAMGVTSLECLEDVLQINRANYDRYQRALGGLNGISMLKFDSGERQNFQYVVLDVDPAGAALTRDELLQVLWAEGALVRRYFYPGCHRMPAYLRTKIRALPKTDRASAGVLVLPTGSAVGESEIEAVCSIIRLALASPDAIRASTSSA